MNGDDRSPETRALDEALEVAILAVWRHWHESGDDGGIKLDGTEVIEDYVAVVNVNSMVMAEDNMMSYSYITKDSGKGPGAKGVHSTLGLLELGRIWFRGR